MQGSDQTTNGSNGHSHSEVFHAFLLTILTHLRLRHSPVFSVPVPSSQPGAFAFPFRPGPADPLPSSSLSAAKSNTHLSPSISTSTPCTILSSTHSLLLKSSTHFLSPHSHPTGGCTSSKNRVPLALSPDMRCGDNGSYGVGLNIHGSHSSARPPLRRCNSKISTSRSSGGASRTMSADIHLSSQVCALSSWGRM